MIRSTTHTNSPRMTSTALGILAILIWSTSFAFGRSIMEQLGTFGGAACIYTLGGGLGCVMLILQRRLAAFLRMPPAYLVICGTLFITYILAVQTGIGFARDRQQAIEVILLNYLWPGLTMALSVPIQRRHARWWLIPGVLLGLAGAMLGVASGRGISGQHLLENLRLQPWPYLLGVMAAISWALYSNLSRRLAGDGKASGVPVFLLASGLAMGALYLFSNEQMHWMHWTSRVRLELLYAALFPGLLAYMFWEVAMRRGRMGLVVAVSYLTPLLATVVTCLYLGVPLGMGLLTACGLVVAGAILSSKAVGEAAPLSFRSPSRALQGNNRRRGGGI
jgi:drug/metabolite transporter (DMT)-like permease